MPGPNLEVFKFGLYLFFPIAIMVYFGDPEWYNRHAIPYRDRIFPREEDTYKPPSDLKGMRAELEKMKAKKIARRLEQEKLQMEGTSREEDERLV